LNVEVDEESKRSEWRDMLYDTGEGDCSRVWAVENYTPESYWSLLEKGRIEAEGEGGGRMEEGGRRGSSEEKGEWRREAWKYRRRMDSREGRRASSRGVGIVEKGEWRR
jgi:hypothetical protein